MSKIEVKHIEVNEPITIVGKYFTGDYSKSIDHIGEVQKELARENSTFIPNKVFGIYYDNPQHIKPDELRSFQGVFPNGDFDEGATSLTVLSFHGQFLYTKVTGDPMKALMDGYGALFSHIQENGVRLKSNAGYQACTFNNGEITTEIYMEIST